MMTHHVIVKIVESAGLIALLNPETPILVQKRHPCTRNLNSETLRDSKIAFLRWGYVLGMHKTGCSGETRLVLHAPSSS